MVKFENVKKKYLARHFFSYETSLVVVIAALLKWNLKADAKSGKK